MTGVGIVTLRQYDGPTNAPPISAAQLGAVPMAKNNKQRTAKTNKPKLTTKEKKAAKRAKKAGLASTIALPKKPA